MSAPGNAALQSGHSGRGIVENENADLEIGDPRDQEIVAARRTWHSRGYIPHFDSPCHIQHVTFHLADSLPKEVLARLDQELEKEPEATRELERRKRIEEWMDAGHGCCVLQKPVIAERVQNALLYFDADRYRLLEWVVMPNHVHVLFQPLNEWPVSRIVASWKKFTARKINEYLMCAGNAALQSGNDKAVKKEAGLETGDPGNRERGKPGALYPFWHREYWDRFIRNERHFSRAREYIRSNPVNAGLVERAEDWPWGSAAPGNAALQSGHSGRGIVKNENADLEIGDPRKAKRGAL